MDDEIDAMADDNIGVEQPDQWATANDDLLGATVVPDINHPGTGWNVYEGGTLLLNILKSNMTPGGFNIQKFGADDSQQDDMGSILDQLAFDPADNLMPWSHRTDDMTASGHVGTPDHDAQLWQPQTTDFTCAIQAQRGIIEAFTGQSISEAQLVYDATVNGWLADGGMSPNDVGNLLEMHGIPCHTQFGASIEDLMAELAQGRKVIVGVDSGELWQNDSFLEDFLTHSADHAIWVTGVDISDPSQPKVIVNDSGVQDGAGKVYDLALFRDAWEDSGFFYVATSDAPQGEMLGASGFDSATGMFTDMVDWLASAGTNILDHLNSDQGREQVADATKTIAGVAGLVTAVDLLSDATFELLVDRAPNDMFQLI